MGSKLYKGNGSSVVTPEDEIIVLQIQVSKSGKIQLNSPLPPIEVSKMLNNLAIDVMYTGVAQMIEASQAEQTPKLSMV